MPLIPVFTDEEVERMRAAIDALRKPGAYEPGKWMVSPLNRRADVLGGEFPRDVVLRDIALRTLEQMPGVNLAPADRLRLLRAVVETGVPSVQLSAFGRGWSLEQMREEVNVVKTINPRCEVVYGHALTRDDLVLAAEAGVNLVQFWAAPFVEAELIYAGNVFRAAWKGEDWRKSVTPRTVEDQIERARRLVAAGKELGVGVSAGLNMLPFAPDEYIVRYSQAMNDAEADEIVLYDGPSGVGPEAYEYLVRLVRQHAPRCTIGVHTHNMFDLAVGNALRANHAGARVLEVSVNGYCAASGQADLAATAVALTALYGIDTGVALEKLTPLSRLAEEISGYRVAWNHPVTGRETFNWGGMENIVQEMKVDKLLHWCLEPTLVGNERRWDITFDSGPYTMLDKLKALGIEVDLSLVEPILARVKAEIRVRRRVLTNDEIREIASSLAKRER